MCARQGRWCQYDIGPLVLGWPNLFVLFLRSGEVLQILHFRLHPKHRLVLRLEHLHQGSNLPGFRVGFAEVDLWSRGCACGVRDGRVESGLEAVESGLGCLLDLAKARLAIARLTRVGLFHLRDGAFVDEIPTDLGRLG